MTFVLHKLVASYLDGARALAATVFIAVGLSSGSEALQALTGGDPEALDVVSDLVGGSAALALVYAKSTSAPRLMRTVALALLVLSFGRGWLALAVQSHRDAIFPLLVSYTTPRYGGVLSSNSTIAVVPAPADFTNESSAVLQVDLSDAAWPGIGIIEPVPSWRGYDQLAIDVLVPAESAPLEINASVRLHNAGVDHVYRSWKLGAGAHRLVFRYRNRFDPEVVDVTRVGIYASRPYAGRRVYFGRIALEKAPS